MHSGYLGVLGFIVLLVTACSEESNGGGGGGGGGGGPNTSGGGGGANTGGGGGEAPGTGLALGTFCIKIGNEAERCEAAGNRAERVIAGGNVTVTVEHGMTFNCTGAEASNFKISAVVPDLTPLPYTNVTVAGYEFAVPRVLCGWRNGGAAASGIMYRVGTQGASHVEGELTFANARVYSACGSNPRLEQCPQAVDARFRFNVPL